MNALSIDSLKDALKSLAQSLQISTIFPAWLFVMVNAHFIVPLFVKDFDPTSATTIAWLISLSLMLSYTLYAFNFPLIRFFEGRKLQNSDFFRWLKTLEEKRFDKEETAKNPRRFDVDYPSGKILSTKIGNTIAAFEEYPSTRYNMDAIALWPRLVPVLKKGKFLDYVVHEKMVFDFLLNTWVVVAVLGVELTYRALFFGHILLAAILLGLMCLILFCLYEGMNVAARQWGTVVRVAFDLYRHDLAQRLCLRPATTFEEELNRWGAISKFLLYRSPANRFFQEFIPQAELAQFDEVMEHLINR